MNKLYSILLLSLITLQGLAQEKLSLKESREMALEYNKKIKIADQMIFESESNVKLAFTHFMPKLTAGASYNYYHDIDDINVPGSFLKTADNLDQARLGNFTGTSNVYFPGLNVELGNVDYYNANLSLQQPIYMGGKIQSAYRMAKIGNKISTYNRQLQVSDVILETDQAYWNLVSVKEKVSMAKKYVDMLSALVQDLNNAFELELTTKNELLKAQVQLNQAKLDLFRTENACVLSRMSLCQVIGKDLQSMIVAVDTSIVVGQQNLISDYQTKAMLQRPELLMLTKQVDLSKESVKNARADYLPQLGVGASYSHTSKVNNLIGSNNLMAVQANLSIPVFHWKERKHKLASARHQSKQRELELERSRDLISLEVQQSYFNLQEAYQQIELARTSMSQANENVTITKNSFYEGLANTTEMLDAQAFWQRAYSELIDAKINFKLKQVSFQKAIGELTN